MKTYLENWATAQLTDMIRAQLPTVNLDSVGPDSNKPKEVKALHEDTRTIKLSQGIDFGAGPQGQLTKISTLVDNDDEILNDLFQIWDLNVQAFADKDISIDPPDKTLCEKLGVKSVWISNARYAGFLLRKKGTNEETDEVNFGPTEMAAGAVTLGGKFKSDQRDAEFTYDYLVSYTGGVPGAYQVTNQGTSMGTSSTSDQISSAKVTWSIKSFGVLYTKFDGRFLPWDLLDAVDVWVRYNDQDLDGLKLDKSTPTKEFIQAWGKPIDKPLEYRVTFRLKGRDPIVYPSSDTYAEYGAVKDDSDVQTVPTIFLHLLIPFAQNGSKEYTFARGDDVSKGMIKALYRIPVTGKRDTYESFETVLKLEKVASVTWKVPIAEGAKLDVTDAVAYDKSNKKHKPKYSSVDANNDSYTMSLTEIETSMSF